MRTGFVYSLYLFSSFVQGSLLLSAANVVSHAYTLARTLPCPHAMCHTVAPRPLARASPKAKLQTQSETAKEALPGHSCQLPTSSVVGIWRLPLPASPGLFPGSCIQGRLHFKKENKMLNTITLHLGSVSHWVELCSSPAHTAGSSCIWPPQQRLQETNTAVGPEQEVQKRASLLHKGDSEHKERGGGLILKMTGL